MPTFTSGNDTYVVHTAGTFDLDMLAGDDKLTVQGGDSTTADMGDGNDTVQLKSGLATVFGGAGNDIFDLWAADATVDGGDGNDLLNLRGGSGISASGGLGVDRFNIYADSANLLLHGNEGDDNFFGYYHSVSGSIYGDAGDDYFVLFVSGVSIYGGTGNDIYRADATNPATFIENVSEGIDSVQVARGASYTLPDNIENISVQGFHGSTTGTATLTGNALNNTINGHVNVETIYGLGGDDRLFAKSGDDTVWGGEGNDYLDGGPGNDSLNGENGNDTINGRSGDDAMAGGAGNDTYYVDSQLDVITENVGEGSDLVRVSAGSYALSANVENAIVSSGVGGVFLEGNALNNELTGNTGNDTLHGSDGADTLKGGAGGDLLYGENGNDTLIGGTGDDYMAGGDGADIYYIDSASDQIDESTFGGADTVYEPLADYTLPLNVENGVIQLASGAKLTGTSLGGNTLTGGAGADQLFGGAGPDTLNGGLGNDQMTGGDGNDWYVLDSMLDLVTESSGQGTDTAYLSVSGYVLAPNVEIGLLAVAGELDGNSLDNTLTGISGGNDILKGFGGDDILNGGAGDDTMYGGIGNDTYYVDTLGDIVDETGGNGLDTVDEALASYTLGADIERGMILLGTGATLTGNELSNTLTGGSGNDMLEGMGDDDTLHGGDGNDTLDGGDGVFGDALYGENGNDTLVGGADGDLLDGGTGDDLMQGGLGNDSYHVDSVGDVVDETFGDGVDWVYETLATYTLGASIEDGEIQGVGTTLNGNSLDNWLKGGGGNDTLYGENGNDTIEGNGGDDLIRGGAGADILYGYAGADTFRYTLNTDSLVASPDQIKDFVSGTDKIDMSAIDANTGVAGDQAFTWTLFPTGSAGQWWFAADGSTPNLYHLFFDFNGGGADMKIDVLTTGSAIATTDIIG